MAHSDVDHREKFMLVTGAVGTRQYEPVTRLIDNPSLNSLVAQVKVEG
jgi:hypothetical protein